MRTLCLRTVVAAALLVIFATAASAQNTPTTEDLTLHPGDTITWTPAAVHSLRFGGTVVTPQKVSHTLTGPEDIEKLLTNFKPALPAKPATGEDIRKFADGATVTATVAPDAAKQKVTEFFFTCGAHPGGMVTMSFVIKPAPQGHTQRNIKIPGGPGFVWFLEAKPANKPLTRQ